jgi:hypothetical protein
MGISQMFKKFVVFLKEDSWQSLLVSIILAVVIIKFVFFPLLTAITGSSLPLVVVESCSMYHESNFDSWWTQNSAWYEKQGITKSDFLNFPFKSGLNKGDIIIVWNRGDFKIGNIIIFNAPTKYPIIHRLVSLSPLETKGDHNSQQITGIETNINKNQIIGKAVAKIPLLGWVKLFFYEPFKPADQRGFCV